jgi:MoxR-like ATPase
VGEIAVVAHGALMEMRQQIADVASSASRIITVNIPTLPEPVTIEGAHRDLPKLVARLHAGMYVMLIGPAGTGKSYMAHDAAKALGVPCYDLSVTVQTQEWKVAGAHSAVTFIRGTIREAYENGGVLLIDEFDNGSPNFLAGLNLLLSSDTYTFADGETVQRHPQFYVVGTANTIGEGGTAQYRARQALDAATLDRFTFMFVDIDPAIEEMLAAQYLEDVTVRADLLRLVRVSRQNVTENNLRVVITPRATLDGAKMLALGEPMDNVIRDRIIRGCSPDIAEKILNGTGYMPV